MDTNIGAKERVTQERLIGLFQNVLKYDYLGNWEYREDNANVEEALLRRYLKRRSYADKEIDKAVAKLKQAAANIGIGLYNANHEVYTLLRYGVNVQSEVSEHKKMVHLIDWANPMENDCRRGDSTRQKRPPPRSGRLCQRNRRGRHRAQTQQGVRS